MNEKQMGIPAVEVTPSNFLLLKAPFLWVATRFALKRSRRLERIRRERALQWGTPEAEENCYELASLDRDYINRLQDFLREHDITYGIE